MDKNVGNTKKDKLNAAEDKRMMPVFVKYGLIAVAVIAAIVIGLLIYFNIAGSYVAIVDGQKIKTSEFKYYLEVQKQTMYLNALKLDNNISKETFFATPISGYDAVEVAKKMALESLKEIKIQYARAKSAKVELTEAQIKNLDDYIQSDIIDKMGEDNELKANTKFKEQYGFSIDDLRKAQIESYTVQLYRSAEMAKIADADANVEINYSKYPEWYKEDISFRNETEEAVWARHILILAGEAATQEEKDAAKKKAEDLISQLKKGADFTTLVAENSEDTGSKDTGGAYIFGKGDMVPEFEKAAFELSPGQITETPVLSQYGYHIIKLEEKYAKDESVSLRCAKEYYEYGTNFVKYKLYMKEADRWIKNAKYKENTAVYNSIK